MKTRMKPVWIKYWGLIPMTRRGYLVTLTVAVAVAAIIVAYCALAGFLPPLRTLWETDPVAHFGWRRWLHNYWWWIVIIALVAQAIDTTLVLRRFAQKEAEERAAEASAAATQARPTPPWQSQRQVKT